MKTTKEVRVYEILADTEGPGACGDGLHVFRFRNERQASTFAATHTTYGRPATVQVADVPKRIFDRWTREGKV